uniref:Uncharacterized protein n=1 Tax=Onchocerca volvulus TaxID=6282 RepID=A0A8R1TTD2_ONCVO
MNPHYQSLEGKYHILQKTVQLFKNDFNRSSVHILRSNREERRGWSRVSSCTDDASNRKLAVRLSLSQRSVSKDVYICITCAHNLISMV